MGSPPPVGTKNGAVLDKKLSLSVAGGTVTAEKQRLYLEYVRELRRVADCFALKGLNVTFDSNTWSRPIPERKKRPSARKAKRRKR